MFYVAVGAGPQVFPLPPGEIQKRCFMGNSLTFLI